MLSKHRLFSTLSLLGLLFGTAGNVTAQMTSDMTDRVPSGGAFRRLEQPLGLKIGVSAGGLALIGLEVWWFLMSKPKSQRAKTQQGIQEVSITVDGGYEPSHIVVNAGQPVHLNFLRCDPSNCLEKVLFPDFHIARDLDLNKVTTIEFTPEEPGQYPFTCGMNMFRGVVEVQASAPLKPSPAL
jgi:plastocyanin domain-containing protein